MMTFFGKACHFVIADPGMFFKNAFYIIAGSSEKSNAWFGSGKFSFARKVTSGALW